VNLTTKLYLELMFRISELLPTRLNMTSRVEEQILLLCKEIIKNFVLVILMK